MKYDKDSLKNSLTLEQVNELVAELGGEPQMFADHLVCKTICHGGDSHKLYYYNNTQLFTCYTGCAQNVFDIYELVRKVKENLTLFEAVVFVANFFGYNNQSFDFQDLKEDLEDWEILNNYDRLKVNKESQKVEFKTYDSKILKFLPHPNITPWINEGIDTQIMFRRGICYDPINEGIVIPHFNIDNNLIGIRERTLIKEEEQYGKYKPAILNGKMYNHPLGFNLYNLNWSKDNIKLVQTAIVFEGEKSCLKYASFFGEDNDISVACCGSNLITYQVNLLLTLGAKEIVIAFDRQYEKIGDDLWKKWTHKLYELNKKYSPYCRISFIFDKENLLEYKDSPVDQGKEVFLELFKRRIFV